MASADPTARTRRRQSCMGSLADHFALELREGCKQIEHQPPLRAGGVNRIVETDQPNLTFHQIAHQFDQMFQRSPHPIEYPDHQHVASAQLTQHVIERRARGLRATGLVLKDAFAARTLERIQLQVGILLGVHLFLLPNPQRWKRALARG